MWFNDVGEFRFNVVSGPFKGDYQIWDGKKYYQYTKAINEMVVRDFVNNADNGVVIPHEIFSLRLIETIRNTLNNGKFNKSIQNKNHVYQYQDSSGEKIEYILNDDQSMLLESQLYNNNVLLHLRSVEAFEDIDNFDTSLFDVNLDNMNILTMN